MRLVVRSLRCSPSVCSRKAYAAWERPGRQVRRGEKALVLCMPILRREHQKEEDAAREPYCLICRACWFALAQTDHDERPPVTLPTWDEERALGTFGIARVVFEHPDGNTQGYATPEGTIAINPVAKHSHLTLFHEIAHALLDDAQHETVPRATGEVEAEGVALLCCEALQLDGGTYARGYLQHWLRKDQLTDANRRVRAALNCEKIELRF